MQQNPYSITLSASTREWAVMDFAEWEIMERRAGSAAITPA
jgi:hypothetical protein